MLSLKSRTRSTTITIRARPSWRNPLCFGSRIPSSSPSPTRTAYSNKGKSQVSVANTSKQSKSSRVRRNSCKATRIPINSLHFAWKSVRPNEISPMDSKTHLHRSNPHKNISTDSRMSRKPITRGSCTKNCLKFSSAKAISKQPQASFRNSNESRLQQAVNEKHSPKLMRPS